MKTSKKNVPANLPKDKIYKQLQDVTKAKNDMNEQIAEQHKLSTLHFSKSFEAGKQFYELDRRSDKNSEKIKQQKQELKKQESLENKIYKTHLHKMFGLEKKAVSLEKLLLKKQLALQKILIKEAETKTEGTKNKADTVYLEKLNKELTRMENRWDRFTEIQ